jgi:bifunctional ADP-heptose synthase (sugar kinase/adenylyltransferase)
MDTRRKIIRDSAGWRVPPGAVCAIGYFDPLLAAHAAQLELLKGGGTALVVCVADPEDPILPREARAELVAALRCVDAVVLDSSPLPPDAADLRAQHLAWRAEFLARVRAAARLCENGGSGPGAR